jgi:hypothetical protein
LVVREGKHQPEVTTTFDVFKELSKIIDKAREQSFGRVQRKGETGGSL